MPHPLFLVAASTGMISGAHLLPSNSDLAEQWYPQTPVTYIRGLAQCKTTPDLEGEMLGLKLSLLFQPMLSHVHRECSTHQYVFGRFFCTAEAVMEEDNSSSKNMEERK